MSESQVDNAVSSVSGDGDFTDLIAFSSPDVATPDAAIVDSRRETTTSANIYRDPPANQHNTVRPEVEAEEYILSLDTIDFLGRPGRATPCVSSGSQSVASWPENTAVIPNCQQSSPADSNTPLGFSILDNWTPAASSSSSGRISQRSTSSLVSSVRSNQFRSILPATLPPVPDGARQSPTSFDGSSAYEQATTSPLASEAFELLDALVDTDAPEFVDAWLIVNEELPAVPAVPMDCMSALAADSALDDASAESFRSQPQSAIEYGNDVSSKIHSAPEPSARTEALSALSSNPLPDSCPMVIPQGPPLPRTLVAKKRRRQNDGAARTRIKQVRREGACLRCRIYKEQCDLNIPCGKCAEILLSARLFKQPCQKLALDDVVVFRPGNARAGETVSKFPKLKWSFDYPESRNIHITYDVPSQNFGEMPRMPITCRRFVPVSRDVLREPYEAPDGDVIWVESPPFACLDVNTAKMRLVIQEYMKQSLSIILDHILSTASDEIYYLGLIEARRFSRLRKDSVVSMALEILCCVDINVQQPIIVGQETLGISSVSNIKFSIHGKRVIPSVLDYQLDTLYINHMRGLMKQISKGLKSLIFKGRASNLANWYQIFLTSFVLLMSLERVYSAQISYVRRSSSGGNNFLASVDHVSRYMISEWRASAKNILYHFRCILRGMTPFSSTWDPVKEKQVGLDKETLAYIQAMTRLITEREKELCALREDDLENTNGKPLVWLIELFLD